LYTSAKICVGQMRLVWVGSMTQLSLTGRYNDGSGAAALPEAQRYQSTLSNAQTPSQESSQESVAWNISGPDDYTEQMYREQSGGYGGFLRGGDNPLDIEAQKKKEDDMDFMEWAAEEAQKAYDQAFNDFMDGHKDVMTFYNDEAEKHRLAIERLQPEVDKIEKNTEVITSFDNKTICKENGVYVYVDERGNKTGNIEDPDALAFAQEEEEKIRANQQLVRTTGEQRTVKELEGHKELYALAQRNSVREIERHQKGLDGELKTQNDVDTVQNERDADNAEYNRQQKALLGQGMDQTLIQTVSPKTTPQATAAIDLNF